MVKKKTCVFISGQGTNLKNIISRTRDKNFPIKISLIISNNRNAKGINYAKIYKIPYVFINTKFKNHDQKVLLYLKRYKISFICLAGYMKIISNNVIKNYKNRIVNIHPSLLPNYKGLNTFARVLKNREIKTGCTVHFVNKNLDDGNLILKKIFFLSSKDNEQTLKEKTRKIEHRAFPEAIIKIFRNF